MAGGAIVFFRSYFIGYHILPESDDNFGGKEASLRVY
jgi:hypothetical protein